MGNRLAARGDSFQLIADYLKGTLSGTQPIAYDERTFKSLQKSGLRSLLWGCYPPMLVEMRLSKATDIHAVRQRVRPAQTELLCSTDGEGWQSFSYSSIMFRILSCADTRRLGPKQGSTE